MKKKLNKRGISLIVLVITIIIMIILAAAIILSLNSSGIIERANKAKNDAQDALYYEAIQMAVNSALLDGNGTLDKANIEKELANQNLKVDETAVYGDGPWYYICNNDKVYTISDNGSVLLEDEPHIFIMTPEDDSVYNNSEGNSREILKSLNCDWKKDTTSAIFEKMAKGMVSAYYPEYASYLDYLTVSENNGTFTASLQGNNIGSYVIIECDIVHEELETDEPPSIDYWEPNKSWDPVRFITNAEEFGEDLGKLCFWDEMAAGAHATRNGFFISNYLPTTFCYKCWYDKQVNWIEELSSLSPDVDRLIIADSTTAMKMNASGRIRPGKYYFIVPYDASTTVFP